MLQQEPADAMSSRREKAIRELLVLYIKSKMRSIAHQFAWKKLMTPGLEAYEVPGDHLDMITEPYVHFWPES